MSATGVKLLTPPAAFTMLLVVLFAGATRAAARTTAQTTGQTAAQTITPAAVEVRPPAERLGYPAGAKLLNVHADDLGAAHSINADTVEAFETGPVNSGGITGPCPRPPEVAAYARARPATSTSSRAKPSAACSKGTT